VQPAAQQVVAAVHQMHSKLYNRRNIKSLRQILNIDLHVTKYSLWCDVLCQEGRHDIEVMAFRLN